MTTGDRYYAAFLDISGRLCTVVGGGTVAHRKVVKLLDAGARVRVVSPELCAELHALHEQGQVAWTSRPVQPGDLDDALLVFAATNDRTVNRKVAMEGTATGKLVNVVDAPREGSFTVPASVRSGSAHVAISTSGTSPATARRLRECLEADLTTGTNTFQKELRKHFP